MASNFPIRARAWRLRSLALATIAACTLAATAEASPRGYGIERLLGQDMPDWRLGRTAAPAPEARPLERLPTVPAPAITPRAPEPAASLPRAPTPSSAAPPADAAEIRVIQKPGRPRSTVSGAWGAAN